MIPSDSVYPLPLFISQEKFFSGAAQFSCSSELCSDNAPESSECESPSDFSATSASDFHHRSMLSMLQKLGPALDHVKACLPQLMAELRELRESSRQIYESAQQQQRFEVALQDLHSELQRLKSYRCCVAGPLCAECKIACAASAPP